MLTWNQVKRNYHNSSLSDRSHYDKIRWFFGSVGDLQFVNTIKNIDEFGELIRILGNYKLKLNILRNYIRTYNEYFKYFQRYKKGKINHGRTGFYRMENNIPKIEISNITGIESLMDNIFKLTERYIGDDDNIEKIDIAARLDILFKAADLLLKSYDQETKRMYAINQTASIINDRDRLMLEAAVINGDEDAIKEIVTKNNMALITDKLLT